jgi:hypothetical protein
MYDESAYSIGKNLTAGVSNTLFTVPTGYEARVTMLYIANSATSGSAGYSAAWHDGSVITFQSNKSLGHGTYDQFGGEGAFLVMNEGDYLTVTPDAGSTFTAIVSFFLLKSDGTKFNLTL